MTAIHVCRYCDGLITNPEDAVEVVQEHVNSGPGRSIWAHREHADLVEPIDPCALRPAHPDPYLCSSGARRLTPEPPAPHHVEPTITEDEKGPSSPEGLTTRPQVKTFLRQ